MRLQDRRSFEAKIEESEKVSSRKESNPGLSSQCTAMCYGWYTVKTFGLLQPYYGHLSCMPVVYVTLYKLQGVLPI